MEKKSWKDDPLKVLRKLVDKRVRSSNVNLQMFRVQMTFSSVCLFIYFLFVYFFFFLVFQVNPYKCGYSCSRYNLKLCPTQKHKVFGHCSFL